MTRSRSLTRALRLDPNMAPARDALKQALAVAGLAVKNGSTSIYLLSVRHHAAGL